VIAVFEYQQYRDYLRDYYLDEKRRKTGLTYARFSSAAGIRAPNFLKMVIDGQKNLTAESIARFSKALAFKEHESEYFEALVHFNQARDPLERQFYEERLQRVRGRYSRYGSKERLLSEYEFEALSDWRHHAVMVLTNVRGFEERAAWIRERLFHLASEQEITAIIDRLLTLKLLERGENGRLRQTNRQVKTRPELGRVLARAFYEGLFTRASQALKLIEPEEREFGTFVVGLSPKQIPELKRRVREFLKSLNDWALENSQPHQVYALNFAAFPLTSLEPGLGAYPKVSLGRKPGGVEEVSRMRTHLDRPKVRMMRTLTSPERRHG
jgi:uncharacterized protein (TIGR02147 family)